METMEKILYATCPKCGAFSAVEGKEISTGTLVCLDCDSEFPLEKELLKTLDEIVGDGGMTKRPHTGKKTMIE